MAEAKHTPLDIHALENVALAAAEHLPGEWRVRSDDEELAGVEFLDRHAGEERWLTFAHCSGGCLEWVHGSEHIATFDPPTVLRLIGERRELLGLLGRIADESVFNQPRYAEDTDTDYFLRCFKAVKDAARAAIAKAEGRS